MKKILYLLIAGLLFLFMSSSGNTDPEYVNVDGRLNAGLDYTVGVVRDLAPGIYRISIVGGSIRTGSNSWTCAISITYSNTTQEIGVGDYLTYTLDMGNGQAAVAANVGKAVFINHTGGPVYFWYSDFKVDDNSGSTTVEVILEIAVDVDIDSDNNNGINPPEESETEENIEETSPGKFVTVNHNDDNENSIPDYSDEVVSGEGNIVPMIVKVQTQADWSDVRIIFTYPGEPTLPSFIPQDMDNDFKDWTSAKKGTIRIWNISSPQDARTSDKYIQPNREYTANELGFSGKKTFYLEGINLADNARIEVTSKTQDQVVKDAVIVTVVEPNLGVNNSNNGLILRPGIPDVNFDIDDDDEKSDEMVEDQKDGFNFWWSRDTDSTISHTGIVDIAPLLINIPQSLLSQGFKFYLKLNDGQLYVYPGVSPSNNRREYLQDVATSGIQVKQTGILLTPGNVQQITIKNPGANEFVFKGIGSGTRTLSLSILVEEPDTSNKIIADTVKLTFRDTSGYWLFVSSRGEPIMPFTYPTEDGREVQMSRYFDPVSISGLRDTEKKKHLVVLHGYNVTQSQAEDGFNEIYRRLFWIGFRGNLIGFTWEGDEGNPAQFDEDVQNAFQTSPSLQRFLEKRMQGAWGVNASDIDIMAHSLGNLVVFDALRLHRRLGTGQLVRNVISYESAIWPEAYEEEKLRNYVLPSDPVTYSIDELKQHSWAFWFRQSDFEAQGAINGAIYHSYLPNDEALSLMRSNDFIQRGSKGAHRWHYRRDRLERTPVVYRAPEGQNNFYDVIPTLMLPDNRRSIYSAFDLTLPVGTQPSPMAEEKNNYLATNGGWRPRKHGDFLDVEGNKMWFPIIYKWYRIFLAGQGNTDIGEPRFQPSPIPVGEE